jgi:hypothetical protein
MPSATTGSSLERNFDDQSSDRLSVHRDLSRTVDMYLWALVQSKLYDPEAAQKLLKIIVSDTNHRPEKNDHEISLFSDDELSPEDEFHHPASMSRYLPADGNDGFLCTSASKNVKALEFDYGSDMFLSDWFENDRMFENG